MNDQTDPDVAWDPDTYLAFADLRSRPGLELLARIEHPRPDMIVDLGCGPGHLTAVLARRWPGARVIGVDGSAEMLARAESQFPAKKWPTIEWEHRDISTWSPPDPVSILYSNAALHWRGDHENLYPRLLSLVAAGGSLAVQMPDNWDQPSHTLISRLADDARWKDRTGPVFLGRPVAEPGDYRAWLQPDATEIDLWRTTYFQALTGADPVVAWVKGSVLRPILNVLEPEEAEIFLSRLATSYRTAYPTGSDGTTIFPFSRFFIVARRR